MKDSRTLVPTFEFKRLVAPNHTSTDSSDRGRDHLFIRPAIKEDFGNIREFLLESSNLYPAIDSWWENRVRPDIEEGRRIALVADSGKGLDGIFIGKPGCSAKLCTLRLRETVRNQGIGKILVAEGLRRLLAADPATFHVTISEAAEEGCAVFFESIGFRQIAVQRNRYRGGVDEFVYSCAKQEVVEAVSNQLSDGVERTLFGAFPKQMPNQKTLLMSLRPEYAQLMLQGHKTIEFRRRFSKKYEGATIVFYITHPVRQFAFMATIAKVDHRQKEHLWNKYEEQGGISETLFNRYFCGTSYGYAIQLSNIRKVPNQLPLERARQVYPKLRPPQSFQTIQPRSPLMRALNLPVHV
jgi:predicted transcriptional regulator